MKLTCQLAYFGLTIDSFDSSIFPLGVYISWLYINVPRLNFRDLIPGCLAELKSAIFRP